MKPLTIGRVARQAEVGVETVRFYERQGLLEEGEPYTGLKPAGRDLGPVIPAADKAIASGSAEALPKLLPADIHAHTRHLFQEVMEKRDFKEDDVKAGREYVKAYVAFLHEAEGLREGGQHGAGHQHGAGEAAEPGEPHKTHPVNAEHKPKGGRQ